MGAENSTREDVIECEINGEDVEIAGVDLFAEETSDETICAMTENAINAEAAERAREQEEINQMMNNGSFSG